ncbi:core-2 i-branching enzyme [Nannochloropsis gaditana]|uniref:protein xylosyltransferase n=1 Tax=Nannochloropsis gaditana TaxID=72520 RepID=W7UCA6_9STRA|nr:core-2 i-branching enzyme [Nannochloropsis gaditana]
MAQWNTGTDMITSYLGRATIFWRTASLLLLFLSGDGQLFVHRSANYKGTCRADTLSNVSYKEVGLVDRPSPGKVAYGVMVYQRQNKTVSDVFDQFTRLFDAIYSPNFTCVVHVDIKSEPALIEKITDYVKKHAPQASTIPSVSVSWGGITVVERTLALMQAALESDPEWEYFVNIGQEDYPLQSPAAIQEYLAHAVPPATNFIYCWDLRGHDFFGQWEHHEGRVSKVFVDMFDGRSREVRGLPRSPPKVRQGHMHMHQYLYNVSFPLSLSHYAHLHASLHDRNTLSTRASSKPSSPAPLWSPPCMPPSPVGSFCTSPRPKRRMRYSSPHSSTSLPTVPTLPAPPAIAPFISPTGSARGAVGTPSTSPHCTCPCSWKK